MRKKVMSPTYETSMKTFSSIIETARSQLGIPHTWFARKLNISSSVVSNYKSGYRQIPADILKETQRIARDLHLAL